MATDNQSKSKRPSFHIAPDAGPDDTIALVKTLSDNPDKEFHTLKELCVLAGATYNAGGRPRDSATVAQMLELIKSNPMRLTAEGKRIATARPERQVELIHLLLYCGWDAVTPTRDAPLWTYREICNLLWERERSLLDAKQIASELTGKLYEDETFGKNSNFDLSKLSFSDKTVRGVLVWLEQLQPPAVQGIRGKREFARRAACSRELLLLGLGWVYRDAVGQPDASGRLNSAELALTRNRREALCKLCLLQPAALEPMLRAVISTYPTYLSEGTTAGALNLFLRLYRMPRLTDEALLLLFKEAATMHRHEYAIQMGLPMLVDETLPEQDPFMFHVAPDAGPDVTLGLLKTLYDNPATYFANMRQLCRVCLDIYGVGTHYFDAAKMARLTNLISGFGSLRSKPIRLTEQGLRIVTAASRLQVDLLHYLLYTGWDEQQPTLRGPLCTYRQACDILWQGGADKLNHQRLLRGVRRALDARFNAVAEYQQLHLSLSGKSMRGVTVWLERLCPPAVADGRFTPRDDCPSELLLLALAWVYRDHIPTRWRNLELQLDGATRDALCRLTLLEPAALDRMLDLALDRHRQYITDGGRGAGGQRIITLHRLPRLTDDALRGRAAMQSDEL